MKTRLLLILILVNSITAHSQIQHIIPSPNSTYNNTETTIVFNFIDKIALRTIDHDFFTITGSISGEHDLTIKTTNNNYSIELIPAKEFSNGEFVNVSINEKIKLENNYEVGLFSFSFQTSEKKVKNNISQSELFDDKSKGFPSITVNTNEDPAPGKIFFHNISALESSNDRYIAIIENDGTPLFAKQDNKRGLGFTLQKNGYLTYWNNKSFYMIDSNYSVIDSFACVNGYEADWHEFQITENGHAFLISWDLQIVDMSLIVPGGQEFATVEGLIIQELDENKDIIFQWRSWDHFNITDAVDVDFTTSYVSYNHGNAIEIDSDTTLLLSSRLMNEITRINRKTGDIIWRLGGKNNQFTFIDDNGFCRQHDVRKLENGNITLFDNGGCHDPQISAAKEYEIDAINKTARLIWKYEHPKNIYSETMGSVQRLPNGNTFINWGRLPDAGMMGENLLPAITEVRPDKSIAYELTFNTFFHMAYRSYRFPWDVINSSNHSLPEKPHYTIDIFPNPASSKIYLTIDLESDQLIDIKINDLSGRLIETIENYSALKGQNSIEMNTTKYSNGIYLCSIHSEGVVLSKKFTIIK